MNDNLGSERKLPPLVTSISGLILVLVLIALETWLMIESRGYLNKSQQIVLYVGLALVTGLSFWLLTPGSSAELVSEQLGARLGGGAAIGAFFVLLSWYLTQPEAPRLYVFPLDDVHGNITVNCFSHGLYAQHLEGVEEMSPPQVLVMFLGDEEEGWLLTDYQVGGQDPTYTQYFVNRAGAIESQRGTPEICSWLSRD